MDHTLDEGTMTEPYLEGRAVFSLNDLLHNPRNVNARFVVVRGADDAPRELAHGQLDSRTGALGQALRALLGDGSLAGAPVLCCLADPLDFITVFLACGRIGAVPVPGPAQLRTRPAHRRRLAAVLRSSPVAAVISTADQVGVVREDAPPGVAVVDVEQLQEVAAGLTPAVGRGDAHPIAYLQYTSGTVSDPRPITLGQSQVLAHLAQAAATYRESVTSVSVNWVPLFHDMGLVTSVLRPLFAGYTSVILDPTDFVRDPAGWPRAMSVWGATHTSSPDFGYALAASRTDGSAGLDLSSLMVARSAGELVRASTMETFARAFAPAGFRREAFSPSYGLAEATLTVTTCDVDAPPRVIDASREGLRRHQLQSPRDAADTQRLVSCGRPLTGTAVVIVDERGERLTRDGAIGEILIAGPQVASGQEHPRQPRLRATGDYGFMLDGELVPIGRSAERFQVHGENFYCGEIEDYLCSTQPQLRRGRVAVRPPSEDALHAAVHVVAEVRRPAWERAHPDGAAPRGGHPEGAGLDPLRRSIVSALGRGFGLACRSVDLVAPGTLPVTTSGKLLRQPAPRTRSEVPMLDRPRAVARLLSVLDADQGVLGLHFIDAGGDSVLAGELCALFRSEFLVDLDLDLWFESETLTDALDRVVLLSAAGSRP